MNFLTYIKSRLSWKWAATVGVILLVVAVLILILCLRSCSPGDHQNEPPGIDPTGGATMDVPSLDQLPEDSTAPSDGNTEQLPDVAPEPDTGDEEPTAAGETEPSGEQVITEPTQPEDTASKPTEPAVTDPVSDYPDTPPQTVLPPADSQLVCKQFASFNGAYVEDGSDEPVENVAAILVRNESDRYLDLANVIYELDGKRAVFRVTGLPAGKSAWVMESTRMQATADSTFVRTEGQVSFRDDAVSSLEGLSIGSAGNMLKVTNERDKTLENVTLYYRVLHTDGNYLGGITYMVSAGTLEPGQSAEVLAGHFKEGWTEIVRIGYQEQD